MSFWPTFFGALSPAGPRARLSVLIFHRVLPQPDPLAPGTVDAAQFDRICSWLARWFNVLPLEQAVHDLKAGRLTARAAAITFDDGYADNLEQAVPILQRHGLCATFFIATGFLDGGRMWNDTLTEAVRLTKRSSLGLSGLGLPLADDLPVSDLQGRREALGQLIGAVKYLPPAHRQAVVDEVAERAGAALPRDLMLRSDQVLTMRRAGMQIGAHTRQHPILAKLPDDEALAELRGSRDDLAALLGEPVRVLAYPNGKPGADYGPRTVVLARDAGFEVAVSTAWGAADIGVDPMQIPRFTPWDRTAFRYGLRLAWNMRQRVARVGTAAQARTSMAGNAQ